MSSFPPVFVKEPLCENDFVRFAFPFSKILHEKIPTASQIIFVTGNAGSLKALCDPESQRIVKETFKHAKHDPDFITVKEWGFFLPFAIGEMTVIAVVLGVDPFIVEKADIGWLLEVRNTALREFGQLKKQRIDWDTGLMNAANLYDLLDILKDSPDVDLMLVELYPKARSSREAIAVIRKSALSLVNFSDNRFLTHYLGHGLFALVAGHGEISSDVGPLLLSWLRKDGFPRVHIGCSRRRKKETADCPGRPLYDEALAALQVAGKRGPFSFCDFSSLSRPEHHPLRRPSRSVVAKLARKWINSRCFSIIQFQVDKKFFTEIITILKTENNGVIVRDTNDLYIFINGADACQAQEWIKERLKNIEAIIPGDTQFFVGIGTYPFADFSKSEVVYNCRKALIHAAFYGRGSVAVFDALSLNISGDLYYGEGDLESAVREYKRGLVCEVGNINLLNSLGVAYAMMERHKQAHQCFHKVLSIDPDNFMALYNLGLGETFLGLEKSAISRFERAIAIHPDDSENADIKRDLQFRLGKLYCETGAAMQAVDILLSWYEKSKGTKKSGYACRFLGTSYYDLKKNREAMVWLQRALQFDEFDAEAMGILGEIYLEEGEGRDIALSLCEKSVELSPTDLRLKLRLAKVQTACGKYVAARNNLRPCLRNKLTKGEARFISGLIYQKEGQTKKAEDWFAKTVANDSTFLHDYQESLL